MSGPVCERGLQYTLSALFISVISLSLPPAVWMSLSPENTAVVCPIWVFTAFVSLTTADPEWEPIVCEQPLTHRGPGTCSLPPSRQFERELWKEWGNFRPSEKLGAVALLNHMPQIQKPSFACDVKSKRATSSFRESLRIKCRHGLWKKDTNGMFVEG